MFAFQRYMPTFHIYIFFLLLSLVHVSPIFSAPMSFFHAFPLAALFSFILFIICVYFIYVFAPYTFLGIDFLSLSLSYLSFFFVCIFIMNVYLIYILLLCVFIFCTGYLSIYISLTSASFCRMYLYPILLYISSFYLFLLPGASRVSVFIIYILFLFRFTIEKN